MNDAIRLQGTSGHARIDTVIREVVQAYEETFPGQIAAYYVEGSYADQTSLPTSDIDLVIIFRDPFADAETRIRAEQLWTGAPGGVPEVDITIIDEESLRVGVPPNLKLGSQLIYGQDVCALYPLLPIETWARERMHAAYWLLVNVYQRPVPVHLPLTFPAPSEEFYGYANRTLHLPDGQEVPCTRNLVRTAGWAATALLALQAREYVGRKRDCARLYRDSIGDEWASLLEEIAVVCRDEWQYLIPTAPRARMQLRSICERTLLFEQHFLVLYRSFLLEQLRSTEPEAVRFARWVQRQLPFEDEEVAAMLMSELLERARAWVRHYYGRHAEHLLKAEEWLERIDPEASLAMRLATVTHDMERAFPGPDSPQVDPARPPDDLVYNQAHSERSVRVVSAFLREQQAPENLIEEVAKLIHAHEFGGWAEANMVQAADSLSFLEVNVDFFLSRIGVAPGDWTVDYVHAKFDWMYQRIQVPEARLLAAPLHEAAMQKLRRKQAAI